MVVGRIWPALVGAELVVALCGVGDQQSILCDKSLWTPAAVLLQVPEKLQYHTISAKLRN